MVEAIVAAAVGRLADRVRLVGRIVMTGDEGGVLGRMCVGFGQMLLLLIVERLATRSGKTSGLLVPLLMCGQLAAWLLLTIRLFQIR